MVGWITYRKNKICKSDFVNCKHSKSGIIMYCKDKNDIKILCVKGNNWSNKWGFPKGIRNKNENVINCSIRKMKDETGITLTIDNLLYYRNICQSLFFFVNEYTEQFKINPAKIQQIKWFTLKELLKCKRHTMNRYLNYFCKHHKFLIKE